MKVSRIVSSLLLAIAAIFSFPAAVANAEGRIVKVENPDLTVYLPNKNIATGRAVVILPGGGYAMLASDHEGHDWAPFFNDKGIAVAILKYRMPNGDRTIPMNDVRNAFKAIRDNAADWNINPQDIGIMGSSAGGHLASTMATHMEKAEKPSFQILFYPVISLDPEITHQGTRHGFLGDNPDPETERNYSNENAVNADTPRAIMLLSDDDTVVPSANSIRYYSALNKAKVPASIHIYPTGNHGWGAGKGFTYNPQVIADLSAWLKSF